MHLLCLAVFVMFILPVGCQRSHVGVPHVAADNLNKGAIFIREGKFSLSADFWIIGLDVNLTSYAESIDWIVQAIEQFSEIKDLRLNYSAVEQETIFNLYKQTQFLLDNVRRTDRQFSALLGTLSPYKRVPRGIFNGGGTILNTLFGVMDDSNLKSINEKMDNMTSQTNNVEQILQHQATIISSNAKLGHNNREEIELVEQALTLVNQKFRKFEQIMTQELRTSTERIEHALQVNAAIREVEFNLNTVREDITDLATALIVTSGERLSSYFLTPANLLTILTQIKSILPTGVSFLTDLDIHSMYQYYSLASVTAAVQDMKLRLFVKIPLQSLETSFCYYKVTPFPVLFGNQSVALHIQPRYRYFAISNTRQQYMEFDNLDTLSCRRGTVQVCDPVFLLKTAAIKSCAYNLFMSHDDFVNAICVTHILPHPEPTFLRPKNSYTWLYSAVNDTVVIRCPDYGQTPVNVTVLKLVGNGFLYMPARCSAHSSRFELRPHSKSSTFFGELENTFHIPPLSDILSRINTTCPVNKTSALGSSNEVERVLSMLTEKHEKFKPIPLQTWTRELDNLRFSQSNGYIKYVPWFTSCGSIGGLIIFCIAIFIYKRFCCNNNTQRLSDSPAQTNNVIPMQISSPPVILSSPRPIATASLWQTPEF